MQRDSTGPAGFALGGPVSYQMPIPGACRAARPALKYNGSSHAQIIEGFASRSVTHGQVHRRY